MERDFLEEIITERSKSNPGFEELVREAEARLVLARALAAKRQKRKLSQTLVAARMGTSQSVVSKIESGAEIRLSTLQRYASIIGVRIAIA